MKVEGSYAFDAPRETVFPLLRDPEVLAKILAGCEHLEPVGDDHFKGVINIKIGPVQGQFDGDVAFTEIEEPERGWIAVNGQGAAGFVSGSGRFWLENEGEGSTLHYEGDAQIGGRLAAVGQRLLDTSARAIIQSGLEGLDGQVRAVVAPEFAAAGEGAPAEPRPRSQAEFAQDVARHMVRDLLGDEQRREQIRTWAKAAGAVLLLYVLCRAIWPSRKVAA